jgi:hypothetical protein
MIMRKTIIAALCAIAVVALAGFAAPPGVGGAGTARAATLCNANLNPCPAVNTVVAPFTIWGRQIGGLRFNLGGLTVSCPGSAFGDTILINPGAPITNRVTSWNFGACTDQFGGACNASSNPAPPPNWATRINTPGLVPGAAGWFAVDGFNVTVTCGNTVCTVTGAGATQTITGHWFNPTTPSPPKPFASPHAEVSFNSPVVVGGLPPCGNGTFVGVYEVTQTPWPGPDLWLV